MPLIARTKGSGDVVDTVHAICVAPGDILTETGSGDVFVVGHGIHRKTDLNEPHTHCPPVYSTDIVTHSPDVFANDLEFDGSILATSISKSSASCSSTSV